VRPHRNAVLLCDRMKPPPSFSRSDALSKLHGTLLAASAVEADGLFFAAEPDNVIAADDLENRPIDADCRRNRTDSKSSKFSFEIKSPDFWRIGATVLCRVQRNLRRKINVLRSLQTIEWE
jgi:hypothetical protein